MKQPIVGDFYYLYAIENWKEVKEEIRKELDSTLSQNVEQNLNDFYSDRGNDRKYTNKVMSILKQPLAEFCKEISSTSLDIIDCWTVSYMKGGFQSPHSHTVSKYSACLYYGFDNNEHDGTRLIINNYSAETNGTSIITPRAEEGILLIYPSNYLHFSTPNKSENPRTLICFDINPN